MSVGLTLFIAGLFKKVVIAEAMAAFVLADALLEKFGGDSMGEVRRNLDAYLARLDERVE